ncbi:MAG: hypothetical protein NZ529_06205 [Cytophagaceae bacterium]|nr:hypothetical protein [Cytophagaceae bacterium]MDW8456371.1 hypothetical protein [Cytophagaceae bacterium]
MRSFLRIVLILAAFNSYSQYLDWVNTFGKSGDNVISSITSDPQGNLLVAGCFSGTNVDFNPGISVKILSSAGMRDIFFGKYTKEGELIWVRRIGGALDDGDMSRQPEINSDKLGNIYVTATFESPLLDLDAGTGSNNVSIINGSRNLFIVKYSSSGDFLWGFSLPVEGTETGKQIAIDNNNDIIIAGRFLGDSIDFDPGPDAIFLHSGVDEDIYFAKYSSNGNLIWAYDISTAFYGTANSVAVDAQNNILLAGYFSGANIDFDPGPATYAMSHTGLYDAFFVKYNPNGHLIWGHHIGHIGFDINCYSIRTDQNNNVYITGYFQGSIDFDFGPSTAIYNAAGFYDNYLAKYDANGNFMFASHSSSVNMEDGMDLYVDVKGNIYLIGLTNSPAVDFDPGPGTAMVFFPGNNPASFDFYVAKYNSSGKLMWFSDLEHPLLMWRTVFLQTSKKMYMWSAVSVQVQ